MVTIENYANRNFLPRVLKNGSRRGVDHHYYSFAHGRKPGWWNDQIPSADKAFAVYENDLGSSHQAIVFCEEELVILGTGEAAILRFEEVERLALPTKDPVSLSLKVILRAGATLELPATTPEGIAFDMYRFLLNAVAMIRRRKKRSM